MCRVCVLGGLKKNVGKGLRARARVSRPAGAQKGQPRPHDEGHGGAEGPRIERAGHEEAVDFVPLLRAAFSARRAGIPVAMGRPTTDEDRPLDDGAADERAAADPLAALAALLAALDPRRFFVNFCSGGFFVFLF